MSKSTQLMTDKKEKLFPNIIVEKITNNNGTAIKYADGTMIQLIKKNINVAVQGAYGSVFVSSAQAPITYLQPFVDDIPTVSFKITSNPISAIFLTGEGTLKETAQWYLQTFLTLSSINGTINIIARGKWK